MDMFGDYRGVVKMHGENGFCKVFVPSIYPQEYADTPDHLPWAEQQSPLFFGGRDGNGAYSYPKLESTVWVFFEGGDINYPIVRGSTLGASTNFQPDRYVINTDKCKIVIDDNGSQAVTIIANDLSFQEMGESKIEFDYATVSNVLIDLGIKLESQYENELKSDISTLIDSPTFRVTGTPHFDMGVNGLFTTSDGKMVTVTKGVITSII